MKVSSLEFHTAIDSGYRTSCFLFSDDRASPSHVLSINMHSKKPMSYTPIDNVKIETPALVNTNDYKIEQVKVSMIVKDEKNNDLQEISGQINL